MKRTAHWSWWIWEESQFLIKYFLESGSNRSVLKSDKHFGYIKDVIFPSLSCQICAANWSNYCFPNRKFAEMYFLLKNTLTKKIQVFFSFQVLHFHISEITYEAVFKTSPSSIYIGKLLIWYRNRNQKLAKRRHILIVFILDNTVVAASKISRHVMYSYKTIQTCFCSQCSLFIFY